MAWLVGLGLAILAVALLEGALAAWDTWIGLALLSALVVFTVRLLLVRYGYVHDEGRVRLLDLLVGVAFLFLAISARASLGSSGATPDQRITLVAGLLALPVASVALVQLAGPQAPKQAGAPTCEGSAVAGSRLQARTGQFGLNARGGPGTTYLPEGRFDAGCVVGVDGYCVGEPVQDVVVPLPDVRWLRLRHSDRYVAAGTLFALSPEAALGGRPEPDCPENLPDPALAAAPKISRPDPDTLLIEARPLRTGLVGLGLYYEGSSPQRLEQLGRTPKLVHTSGPAFARLSLTPTRASSPGSRHLILAVVPCLAPVVPSHDNEHMLRIDLTTGRATAFADPERLGELRDRLRQAACRVDPSATNKEIASAATSTPP